MITKELVYPDKYKLTIFLTKKCNFDCSFCNLHDNSHNDISFEKLKSYISWIEKFIIKNRPKILVIKLIGGEPTVYSQFDELIDFIFLKFNDYKFTIDIYIYKWQ